MVSRLWERVWSKWNFSRLLRAEAGRADAAARRREPFPASVSGGGFEGEDGGDEVGAALGAAAQAVQEAPGFEGGGSAFAGSAESGVGGVDGGGSGGQVPAAEGDADGAGGALVAAVGQHRDVVAGQGVDQPVAAGGF